MPVLAAHAVRPTCSRCGHTVRSSIEIGAEVSELQELLAAAGELCRMDAPQAGAICSCAAALATDELERLHAELIGDHLSCARCAASPELGRLRSVIASAAKAVNDCQSHTSC
jgi:hypothetical protein